MFMSTSAVESSVYARSSMGVPSTIPTLVAATKSVTGMVLSWSCSRSRCSASTSATNAPLIELLRLRHRAQRAANQPLDFLGATADPAGGRLALHPCRRGARQHAVLGRHPPLSGVPAEWWYAVFHTGRADDTRPSGLDKDRSFGVYEVIGGYTSRTKLLGKATVCAHDEI